MEKFKKNHLRGLANLPKERVREIASMGGKAALAMGVGHRWDSEEAKAAVKKRYEK